MSSDISSGIQTEPLLFRQELFVKGNWQMTLFSDPLGRVYPYCIGHSLWSAAVEMVKFWASFPDTVIQNFDGQVLELGAGIGAVSIAFASLGAEVIATDQALALPLLKRNVEWNSSDLENTGGERGKIRVVELVWGDFTQLGQVVNKAALSLVVAADVVYDEDQFEPLIETIRGCYRGHSQPKVVISFPDRMESRPFLPRAAQHGLGWRMLRRVDADESEDLTHDCLIVELFPLPMFEPLYGGAPAPLARQLVVFDFDWTLVEDNSDTFVLEKLGARQFLESLQREGEASWTRAMDRSLQYAGQHLGAAPDSVRSAARETPMDRCVADAVRALAADERFDLHIASDANSVFISEILERRGLSGCFKGVHTNPAAFEGPLGALRVRAACEEPHGCPLCPPNLCKGSVLERLLAEGSYARVVYVGDGANDLCPCCRTGPWDLVLARRSYPDGRAAPLLRRALAGGDGAAAAAPRGPAYTGARVNAAVAPWDTARGLAELLATLPRRP